mmetsp:Transcript_53885/g.166972  ORF Transcript_53885/g.166972 Transcript_53885/m.166972 type:complete len:328 (+) Transcript_53885:1822-2805(+)
MPVARPLRPTHGAVEPPVLQADRRRFAVRRRQHRAASVARDAVALVWLELSSGAAHSGPDPVGEVPGVRGVLQVLDGRAPPDSASQVQGSEQGPGARCEAERGALPLLRGGPRGPRVLRGRCGLQGGIDDQHVVLLPQPLPRHSGRHRGSRERGHRQHGLHGHRHPVALRSRLARDAAHHGLEGRGDPRLGLGLVHGPDRAAEDGPAQVRQVPDGDLLRLACVHEQEVQHAVRAVRRDRLPRGQAKQGGVFQLQGRCEQGRLEHMDADLQSMPLVRSPSERPVLSGGCGSSSFSLSRLDGLARPCMHVAAAPCLFWLCPRNLHRDQC